MARKTTRVPSSRAGRFGRMTRLAGGIAAGIAGEGIRQWRSGNRPALSELAMTPANAKRLTRELSKMRGAAMKLGQLLSLEASDMVPKELSDILSQLRADAHRMPGKQLDQSLKQAYGENWRSQFDLFEWQALAAASIGEVHRARSRDGKELALKIQYPGVTKSIDSDVDNLSMLLRTTGLLPKQMNIAPLLKEVKEQLKEEANYLREAQYLNAFREHLASDDRFYIPECREDLTHETVLAMEFVAGDDIENLEHAPLETRNAVVSSLLDLMFHELFSLRLMQTDPNFANYRYNMETGKIVLLDFGACRQFSDYFVEAYRQLMIAVLSNDREGTYQSLLTVGYDLENSNENYREAIVDIFEVAGKILSSETPYPFNSDEMRADFQDINDRLMAEKNQWTPPPGDALYLHRKLGGLLLLASRLKTEFPVKPIVTQYL